MKSKQMSSAHCMQMQQKLSEISHKARIAIDLNEVEKIDLYFLDFIKSNSNKNKISLYNVNTNIMLFLYITKNEKYAKLYLNKSDFLKDKRQIIRRRFKMLKSA